MCNSSSAIDVKVTEERLKDMFKLDTWKVSRGLKFLLGLSSIERIPQSTPGEVLDIIRTLDSKEYNSKDSPDIAEEIIKKYNFMDMVWYSGDHEEYHEPSYFIGWALYKGFTIPWLDDAVELGLYTFPYCEIKENTKSYNANIDDQSHQTKYLKLIESAIQHFYISTRTIDPKKNEVVHWLEEESKRLGLNGSKNIFDAIFTIIKPEDHNPKKRKG